MSLQGRAGTMTRGRSPLREPTGPWDLILGLLAIVSLGIFFAIYTVVRDFVPEAWSPWIVIVDVGICVLFALDYVTRMLSSDKKPISFARENFLQPFAMIPFSTPVLGEIQLLVIIIVIARFVRAFNVIFGQKAFQSILRRYSGVLAREITDAVMIRSLSTAKEITDRGRFAASIADSLDRRRDEVSQIVSETLERHPSWQHVKRIPGTDELVARIENLIIDTMLDTMRSDRLNELVGDVINDSIEDFRAALEAKHPGVTQDALGADSQGRGV